MNNENETPDPDKPKRLYFKTYLQVVRNAVGTSMFRNFYVQTADGKEMDAMSDGSNSGAFFVSAILTLFHKLVGVHGTVSSTVKDLEKSDWEVVSKDDLQAGDVLVWEALKLEGTMYTHIGFYVGDDRAISASWTEKKVVEHSATFDGKRAIEQVFRHTDWE